MKAPRMPGLVVAGLVAGAIALGAPEVGAITKDQCVDANTKAQSLRRDGKFAAAREQLTLCIDQSCPGIVRDDCTQRLDELERAQPTVVFDAKSAVGEDVVLVHVAVDGVRLADVLDGRALGVDPGQHVFTFEVPGQAPTTYRFVLKEGEKDRRERIVLAGAPEPTPARVASCSLGATRRTDATSRRPGARRGGPRRSRRRSRLRRPGDPRLVQLQERVREPHVPEPEPRGGRFGP